MDELKKCIIARVNECDNHRLLVLLYGFINSLLS